VGAGIAGLTCARRLTAAGIRVAVFDKGRRVGGRLSTRESAGWQFDHGAQFFTVTDPGFAREVEAWRTQGVVAPWNPRTVTFGSEVRPDAAATAQRLVGVPRMQAIAEHLAAGLDVRCGVTASRLGFSDGGWHLYAEEVDLGGFDLVVLALPAPQAARLVENTTLALDARGVLMVPCWTVLVGYDTAPALDFDAASVSEGPLSWIVREASKPGRPQRPAWVLQASPDWSMEHLDDDATAVTAALVGAFAASTGTPADRGIAFIRAHRWRFALPVTRRIDPYLFDFNLGIGLCGDWCAGARVEGAFLSGVAMAARLIETCDTDQG
jgi:predicted NAD/FAD-dependent oxidoreductase